MACKGPGEEIAYETTVSILRNVLSSYPWHVKAVLTLASFALDYGEFSHLADQIDSLDQLTKSLGILKQVPIVLGRQGIEKYKNSFGKLNTLIKLTLDVVECVVELEKRIDGNNTKDVPELSLAIENMSIDVFWTIITIVDCMARICSLINDKDNTQELLPFTGKITSILKSLTDQIAVCDRQIDLESLQGIVEFFKKLIFVEESHNLQQATISNNELVISRIEELKTKNVLLFFSDLDISEEDVSILKPIHKEITKIGQYKIVWIPIVEQWMQIKYEMLQSKYKMEWYIVPHFSSVLGIKYIKEEWKFKNKPIIVVLNEEGTIKHHDAFHMIKTWGIEALPFDYKREKELCKREDWFGWSMINFSLNISTWDKWIEQFHQEATKVKEDLVMGGGKIVIELFGVGKDGKGKDNLGIFWKNIENFYFSKSQKVTELETKTKEIQ
ncbi:protein sieve element occlusion b [Quercus suber]|uniref:Protein sieve element occlusion b n=1 Tax=Quercus suber TaxID=58331 RepID=A0AAW0KD54_QUESU